MTELVFLERINDLELMLDVESDKFEVYAPDGHEMCAFENIDAAHGYMLYETTSFPSFDW